MDFTGARRRGSEEEAFYKEVANWLIAKCRGDVRYHPLTREEVDPSQHVTVRNWRAAGYGLSRFLVPRRKGTRQPIELESFIEGLRQGMQDYEMELDDGGGSGAPKIRLEAFNVEACEKLEEKAEKYLKLATHENTPIEEARAAALALARMVAGHEMVLLGYERVRHFSRHLRQMEDLFEVLRHQNPLMFFYGAKEQLGKGFIAIIDDEFGHGGWR
jgi:hypothetical protein